MNDQTILTEIELIKNRNERVALDKAWEISWTRKLCIATTTYIIASVWLWTINETSVYLKAVVPTVGYLLSTLTMPYIKRYWTQSQK